MNGCRYIFLRGSFRKKKYLTFVLLIGILNVSGQQHLEKSTILKSMRLANNYFMNLWPDAGCTITTNKTRQSHIWTRSVYYEGLLSFLAIEPDKTQKEKYLDYALSWGNKHQWGINGGTKSRNADNHCAGQDYYDLYVLTGKKNTYMLDSIKCSLDKMLLTEKIDDWSWIDAIQMDLPIWVSMGLAFNDTNYFHRANLMYDYTKNVQGGNGLYNSKEHLWWRDKDFLPPYKEPNGANCYWSRGNGWVAAALVRVLKRLPKSDSHYTTYLKDYKDMCNALLPLQKQDGFWNVSLVDTTSFPSKELTGTSLFTYAFAYGINHHLLDEKEFSPAINKAWNAMVKDCVHPNGFLGWVQGTGKEPKDGQPLGYDKVPDFEDYGLGCFLLAGSEVYKLKSTK